MKMYLQRLLLIGIVFFVARSAYGVIEIKDNATGGDCTKPAVGGLWNAFAKTCTLSRNLADTIKILDSGVTLDGANQTLNGGNMPLAIDIDGLRGVTVRNLKISNFKSGIRIFKSINVIITNNDISNITVRLHAAVDIHRSSQVYVFKNKIHDNEADGVSISGGGGNRVQENTLENNGLASVYLASKHNWIVNNEIINGRANAAFRHGIRFRPSTSNTVWGNRIKDHKRGDGISMAPAIGGVNQNLIIYNTIERNSFDGVGGAGRAGVVANMVLCNDFRGQGAKASSFGLGSRDNVIVWNNFFDQDSATDIGPPATNTYFFPKHVGGNYWQQHPCVDANNDKFCDAPFVFAGDSDKFPHKNQIPWKLNPLVCLAAVFPPQIESVISQVQDKEIIPVDDDKRLAFRLLVDDFADANYAKDIDYAMSYYAVNPQIQLLNGKTLQGQTEIRNWLLGLFEIDGYMGPLVVHRVLEEDGGLRALGYFNHTPRARVATDEATVGAPDRLNFDIRMIEENGQIKIQSERWEVAEF